MKKDLMVKKDRKLRLTRETLRTLEEPSLAGAIGGVTTTREAEKYNKVVTIDCDNTN